MAAILSVRTVVKTLAPTFALALGSCVASRMEKSEPPTATSSATGTLEGRWRVVALDNTPLATPLDIMFDPGDMNTSRVSGDSGCNRYSGSWKQTGVVITLGPLAGTRMACDAARMGLETRLLGALSSAATVSYPAPGRALLSAPDGRRIALSRDSTR
jgi:heat shock protein HslJ